MKQRRQRRYPVWVPVSTLFLYQLLYHCWLVSKPDTSVTLEIDTDDARDIHVPSPSNRVHLQHNQQQRPVSACLMIKDDNDNLQEWLAYHYTTLSLRYLVIGEDYGNSQDPRKVLELYNNNSGLQWWVLSPHEFTATDQQRLNATNQNQTTGNKKEKKPETAKQRAHHAFVDRQKNFVTRCLQLLKTETSDATWTLLIDSDEYVAAANNNLTTSSKNGISLSSFLFDHQHHNHPSQPCLTLPRLLIGALENRSCAPVGSSLTTLRFAQHAPPSDFYYSKFAKSIVDVSRLPLNLSSIRNIHRPFLSCPSAAKTPSSVYDHQYHHPRLYLHHYVGSWERYASRSDARRDRAEWEKRAFVNSSGAIDCHAMRQWVQAFLRDTTHSAPVRAQQAIWQMIMSKTNESFTKNVRMGQQQQASSSGEADASSSNTAILV